MKKKFTFVDAAIILVVLCVVLGAAYYLTSKSIIKISVKGEEFGYTLCVSNVREEVANQFKEGGKVFDATKQIEIGTIDSVKVVPHEDVFLNSEDGEYVKEQIHERYRVMIHVTSNDAVVTDSSVTVNNYELYYGKTCYIRGNNFACSSVLWGLDTKEGK